MSSQRNKAMMPLMVPDFGLDTTQDLEEFRVASLRKSKAMMNKIVRNREMACGGRTMRLSFSEKKSGGA